MDLIKYYTENIKKDEYYYKFYADISLYCLLNSFEFKFYDDHEAIQKFRSLCMPPDKKSEEEGIQFILICYYLKNRGYYIKEFPRLLDRPTTLGDFAYNDVRTFIHTKHNYSGAVAWADRRTLINQLVFEIKNDFQPLEEDIKIIIQKISTRGAEFDEMPIDERLATLNNLLENLLKKDDGFINVDYEKIFLNYITDDIVKKYRKSIQCFRHGAEASIEERKTFTEEHKKFLVDYGILISNYIYKQNRY